ncbi:MAG: NAD(P)/FAD-dependent oxidoreductase [Pikeienuella sp.]
MTNTADILIIGAGVAGLGAAAYLAPSARVVVLEGEAQPCYHTSGRSAAMFLTTYGPTGVRVASVASAPFYDDPPDVYEGPLLSPRGELHLDSGDGSDVAAILAANPDYQDISVGEALSMVPILNTDGISRVAFDPIGQDVDTDLLVAGYRRLIRAFAGQLVCNARVESLTRVGGQWRAVTPAGEFEAPIIVNAAGAWATQIAEMAGAAAISIIPKRRSAAIVPLTEHDPRSWPMFFEADESFYARPMGAGLMVSPAEEIAVEPQDMQIDKYDDVLVEGLWKYSQRVTVPLTQVLSPWAGLRSFSNDGEPVVGFDGQAEGFFWLAGQGGYGFQTSPALSQMVADLITGVEPSIDPELFTPARFG